MGSGTTWPETTWWPWKLGRRRSSTTQIARYFDISQSCSCWRVEFSSSFQNKPCHWKILLEFLGKLSTFCFGLSYFGLELFSKYPKNSYLIVGQSVGVQKGAGTLRLRLFLRVETRIWLKFQNIDFLPWNSIFQTFRANSLEKIQCLAKFCTLLVPWTTCWIDGGKFLVRIFL